MAINCVVSVFDSAAQLFSQPQCVLTIAQAVRGFTEQVRDGNSMVGKHPEDFVLYDLGLFDDCTGKFQLLDVPRIVTRAKDLVS